MSNIQPIRCLAIVNRGEAAMRCIRAVKSLGAQEGSDMKIVALYTDVDRGAPFVRHADIAVRLPIPGATAVSAYLDHNLLISTLKRVGADAVWPGWGFVAEDPVFVDRLTAEGIRFLGPSANTMRALGDKISSKELAERAEVPVTPWSGGVVKDEQAALHWAKEIGLPVVIKASAGGGGRGIRIVRDLAQLESSFQSASAEAKAAFGDGRLFMEAMVQGGRHIEVQIAADQHGNVAAVGCRDCSVQRRHQKVLEEAPPPGLPPLMIRALTESAVELAASVGYHGVGTVEFMVSGADYYFLEMNPRLQVEHGITEELTGTDLVQLQIRVARGETLPTMEFREQGHSIEARVCAEDPDAGFLPAPGDIARFDPALGRRLRVDTGVAHGSTVPPDFDSLIAKVIATGDTREEAVARLIVALRDFDVVIKGGSTNKSYLLDILATDAFRQGGVDTGWLDRWNLERNGRGPYAPQALVLAAIVAYQEQRKNARANFYLDPGNLTQDKVPPSIGQEIDLSYLGKQYRVTVFASGSYRYRVHLNDKVVAARMSVSGSHAARLQIGDADLRVLYDLTDASIRLEIEGSVYQFGRQTAGQVQASAPSMVVRLNVQVGDTVTAGQSLGLVEAMKMEISFDAPVSGVVTEVRARKGQQVAAGDTILVIDPAAEEEASSSAETLELPNETDPLSPLFQTSEDGALLEPDLHAAVHVGAEARNRALQAVTDDVRRIVLGYDANPRRVEKLIAFLRAPVPSDLPQGFLEELVGVHHQLRIFVDIETLFTRRPTIEEDGKVGLSNSEQLRTYVRRMRACGEGLPEKFLTTLRAALSHYDYSVQGLEYGTDIERCVMRLFASQLEPQLRQRLIMAVIQRVSALAAAGVQLGSSAALRASLARITSLRGHLTDALADAAAEATYRIFLRPELDRAAEHTTQRVNAWLRTAEPAGATPPADVVADLAMAPPGRFRGLETWLTDSDRLRNAVILAAYVRRAYAPATPKQHAHVPHATLVVERMELSDGRLVFAALASADQLELGVQTLTRLAQETPNIAALELVTANAAEDALSSSLDAVRSALGNRLSAERLTLSVVGPVGSWHETFVRNGKGEPERREFFGLHPEAAERVDFERYQSFELERLSGAEGIYCFYGKSREVPEDERIFVLVDVRTRPPVDGQQAVLFVPGFEQAFHEATRTLRSVIAERDPRRRLHWNRVTVFLAQPVLVDEETALHLARKLHPATRHLGLERVGIRLKLLNPASPTAPPKSVEIVVSDPTGNNMEITWREPHTEALVPATDYVRRVLAAKRRGLIYPYEIVRMLAPEEGNSGDALSARASRAPVAQKGDFEEYDLDQTTRAAVSVRGRAHGLNKCSIVFGVISTPTRKVPEGMRRVLILSDPTRDLGALAGPECDRIVAALDLADRLRLPVEWLPVSSGAKIAMDSGTENLDATARVVRRIVTFTQGGGVIHLIITGINVGAQSYWDSLATMLGHTRGVLIMTPQASMVLTGRAALKASGSVAAEDEVAIGGYERVMGPNGQAQYFAKDLAHAYSILYQHYEYTYVYPGERHPRPLETTDSSRRDIMTSDYTSEGFSKVGEIFQTDTNPGRKKPFAMRDLMAAIVDQDGGHLERWQTMVAGETAIVWDAHLGGNAVCIIGIESQNVPRWGYRPLDGPLDWNGGTLFPQSSKKLARAINSASGNRPVVIIANLSGFDGSPESMRKLQLEYGAEIARAVVNFQGPIVFLVVSRYHGGAYVVFSRELNPGLRAFAVEGSYASVIGGGPAAAVVFPREVGARVSADKRAQKARAALLRAKQEDRRKLEETLEELKLEKQAEVAAEFDAIHSVERAMKVGSLEAIIAASDIRGHLVACLSVRGD